MSPFRPQEEVSGWAGRWVVSTYVGCLFAHSTGSLPQTRTNPCWLVLACWEPLTAKRLQISVVVFDRIAVGSLDVFTSPGGQHWRPAVCHCLATGAFAARPSKVTLFLSLIELCWAELDFTVNDKSDYFFFLSACKTHFFSWHNTLKWLFILLQRLLCFSPYHPVPTVGIHPVFSSLLRKRTFRH